MKGHPLKGLDSMSEAVEKLRCFYIISYNQTRSEAVIRGVGVGVKEKVFFEYNDTVKTHASHKAELIAVKRILERVANLEKNGVINAETDVVVYGSNKGIIDLINHGLTNRQRTIILVKEITSMLREHRNWSVSWKREVRNTVLGILKQGERARHKQKETLPSRKVVERIKNEDTQIVFYDVEMNCSGAQEANTPSWEIISLGAVKYRAVDGEETGRFYSLVRPLVNRTLDEWCSQLTGINQEEVDGARDFNTMIEEFFAWIGIIDNTILVSWGVEDIKALERDMQTNKSSAEILEKFKVLKDSYCNFQTEFSRFAGSHNPLSLKNALGIHKQEFCGTQHNALYDACNLAQLYRKYREIIEEGEVQQAF